MDEITRQISQRLKAERGRRDWSLSDLAQRAQVSRAMISKIERGEVSATAMLLAKLAQAFDLTLSSLFSDQNEVSSPLIKRAQQAVWTDPASGYVRRSVTGGGQDVDIVEVDFPAGTTVIFENSPQSRRPALSAFTQYVWLLQGRLTMHVETQRYDLDSGDCLLMPVNSTIIFHNPSATAARYAVILWRADPPL